MLNTVYKWTREKYTREEAGRGHKWQYQPEETEITYITPSWMEEKTGREEVNFFRCLGAEVKVTRYYSGRVDFLNISPDRLTKCVERFEPVSIWEAVRAAGYREQEALIKAVNQRIIPIRENSADHVTLLFGDDERTAEYDLITKKWVA